jgi:hypothetical protein
MKTIVMKTFTENSSQQWFEDNMTMKCSHETVQTKFKPMCQPKLRKGGRELQRQDGWKKKTFWQYFFNRSLSFACCSSLGRSRKNRGNPPSLLGWNCSDSIWFFRWLYSLSSLPLPLINATEIIHRFWKPLGPQFSCSQITGVCDPKPVTQGKWKARDGGWPAFSWIGFPSPNPFHLPKAGLSRPIEIACRTDIISHNRRRLPASRPAISQCKSFKKIYLA